MSVPPNHEATLFELALEKPAGLRPAFLDAVCAGNPALRQRLEALLAAHAAPAHAPASTIKLQFAELPDEVIGQKIGRYKILERVGEGGCGVVYVAEQTEPVRRRVALKVIKLGMDTKQVIARFEAERQALALMDHPNIAKVLDGGATESGRPYFIMELVRGIKITDYCDQASLPTWERLELFIKVCQAIQHAHQKGIIHRDIKPSNILVTLNDGVPVPKVIDFGIAKATDGRLTDATVYTQLHQFIGTPVYMSPEQAEMTSLDIDTRSDIYSLGVLLYELLAGTTPFDAQQLMSQGIDAMRRMIREQDPARPSTRLATLKGDELTTAAKRRAIEGPKLIRLLKGDLDWIVMKCLEKDRSRRYNTATGLVADLKRHLNHEPVVARPPSKLYEFQKTLRRHRVGFATTTAIMLALSVGIAISVWQANRAQYEATRAQHEAARAKAAEQSAVTAFNELRDTAPAFAEQAHALAEKEHFSEAIEKLDYAIKLQPDTADYLIAKGDLLQCQLKLPEAAATYRQALRVSPGNARADASARLCDDLLAAPLDANGKLTRESLAQLFLAMQEQQRPTAEMMPVARLLGQEKNLLLDYWLARLKDLPVSPEYPLARRLTVRDDGRLALDLSGTKVTDLSLLVGAPLATLDASNSKDLTDLSPLRGLALVELNVSGTSVADLTPLRGMQTLEKLNVLGSKVSDLAPLDALRLKSLNLASCGVSDLTPVQKMPLEEVDLGWTRVTDLSPLIGMPIKRLNLSLAPVVDFSPLAQFPLETCLLQGNRITDLGVLRGKPLKVLSLLGCVDARNYAVLPELKNLEILLLDPGYRNLPADDFAAIAALRHHPRLRQLGADILNNMGIANTGSKDLFWQDWDREQAMIAPLRQSGITFALQKLPEGTYSLTIENQPLRDLSFLPGLPVSELSLSGCPVADLTPLQTLPLQTLYLDGCPDVTDVALLAGIPTLQNLTVPVSAGNIEALRPLANLRMLAFNRINGTPASTVAEFWQDNSADGWISRLRASGVAARHLSKLADGTWEINLGGSKLSDLALLRGVPISHLEINNTAITDLSPLRGIPLKTLYIDETSVTDLSPLQGMPLEDLSASGTPVTNLFALAGMPLISLRLHDCGALTDVSPLATCPELHNVTLPPKATNLAPLRTLPKLERLSFKPDENNGYRPAQTAAEFWQAYDAKQPGGNKPP
jgi:serine/threonine protein kinase/Leucine-rich repeat (LRR) protein